MPKEPLQSTAAERETFLLAQIATLQEKVRAATAITATSSDGRLSLYAQPEHLENLRQSGIAADPMPAKLFLWHQKSDAQRNRPAKDVYLADIGAVIICRVTGTGETAKVAAAYGLGGSFAKPMPVDVATVLALRTLLNREPTTA